MQPLAGWKVAKLWRVNSIQGQVYCIMQFTFLIQCVYLQFHQQPQLLQNLLQVKVALLCSGNIDNGFSDHLKLFHFRLVVNWTEIAEFNFFCLKILITHPGLNPYQLRGVDAILDSWTSDPRYLRESILERC